MWRCEVSNAHLLFCLSECTLNATCMFCIRLILSKIWAEVESDTFLKKYLCSFFWTVLPSTRFVDTLDMLCANTAVEYSVIFERDLDSVSTHRGCPIFSGIQDFNSKYQPSHNFQCVWVCDCDVDCGSEHVSWLFLVSSCRRNASDRIQSQSWLLPHQKMNNIPVFD